MQITHDIDAELLENLFRSHYNDLARYAYTIVKDQGDAEDVVQQLFVKLWEKREELAIEENAKAYLYRATYNASINKWNRSKRTTQLGEDQAAMVSSSNETSDRVISKDLEEKIEIAISTLPEKCQEVFRLSRFNDLSYKEIAEQLEISTKTVENHMGKALKIMRSELAEYLPQLVVTLLLSMRW